MKQGPFVTLQFIHHAPTLPNQSPALGGTFAPVGGFVGVEVYEDDD